MKKESRTHIVARYYPDGRIEEHDERLTLKEMQEAVGGYILLVSCAIPGRSLIVNEDGNQLSLALNPTASRLVSEGVLIGSGLRGVVLLVA